MKKPQAPPVPNTSGSGGGGGSNTAGGSAGGGEVNYHPLGAAVSAAPPPLAPSSLTGHQPGRSQEGAGPGRETLSNLVVLNQTLKRIKLKQRTPPIAKRWEATLLQDFILL